MKLFIKSVLVGLAVVAIMIMIASVVSGCGMFGQRLNRAAEAFTAENPTVSVIPVDEDGDGATDFLGVDADGDGKADTDPAGKLVEVPGSREAANLDKAEIDAADSGLAELLVLAGAAGVPAAGVIGAWWGKRKPVKRLVTLANAFEMAKQSGSPEGVITVSKAALELYLQELPGFTALLNEIRAKAKASRKMAQTD